MELTTDHLPTLILSRSDIAQLLDIGECMFAVESVFKMYAEGKAPTPRVLGVHAELGEVIAGRKPGRERDGETIIFDSTGTALQDIVSAAIVFEKAMKKQVGLHFDFQE